MSKGMMFVAIVATSLLSAGLAAMLVSRWSRPPALDLAAATSARDGLQVVPGSWVTCLEEVSLLCGRADNWDCAAEKLEQFSDHCRPQLEKHLKRGVVGCEKEIEQHCSNIRPGGGRLIQCLRIQKNRLSPSCAAAIKFVPDRAQSK